MISKTYNPADWEQKLYKIWESSGAFQPASDFKTNKTKRPDVPDQSIGKSGSRPEHRELNDLPTPFVIPIPPPNITGKLHIGHVLFVALEDILIRYHRMIGDDTLWLPGTDHASIATENVVVKELKKKDKTKHQLGRDKFLAEVWKWARQHQHDISNQIRRAGASCDWTREKFTLDDDLTAAVNIAFERLYKKGLIYRGDYLVNWCPRCNTAVSDDEVEYKNQRGNLWYIKYPLANSKGKQNTLNTVISSEARDPSVSTEPDGISPPRPRNRNDNIAGNGSTISTFITIATTRPETMLGDTAVAVHPEDKRYKKLIGMKVQLPLTDREIPIIADKAVDPEFGTGAVKVTPAHDKTDWEIGQRHQLTVVNVIGQDGLMTKKAGKDFEGLKIKEAREKIISQLEMLGLLDPKLTKQIDHRVGACYRCETPVEPLISKQWFVKTKPLAQKAIRAIKSGKLKIIPKRFEKTWFHWLENIRDWCISRQLWWGHRLPVWYKQAGKFEQDTVISSETRDPITNAEIGGISPPRTRGRNDNTAIRNSQNIYVGTNPPAGYKQDPDVLDTWFSSALWPFSTVGWPDIKKPDYQKFYPATVLETGYDILFFWVARMVMMGTELTGKIPFEYIYLHGLVRDEQGRKISKSLGNYIEPIDLMQKWGTDAIRMTLVVGTTGGNDVNFTESKAKGYRNFANKIWNASRFVNAQLDANQATAGKNILKLKNFNVARAPSPEGGLQSAPQTKVCAPTRGSHPKLTAEDSKKKVELEKLVKTVTADLNNFRFSRAGEKTYEFFWHTFCDQWLEQAKTALQGDDDKIKFSSLFIIHNSLFTLLKLLHPFMPFVTEACWQQIPMVLRDERLLISAKWPN